MFLKTVFKKLTYDFETKFKIIARKASNLHSNLANDIISSYSDKSKRSGLKQSGYVYIVDPETANSIATYITQDWKDGYIVEANPGPGILTSSLLQNSVPKLRVFEKNKDFLPALETLSTSYPKLEIIQEDLLHLPSLECKTASNDTNYLEYFFRGIPEISWEDGTPFRLFSIISSKKSIKFIRYLLAVLPLRSSIFALGRCELFLLTTESEYMYMKAVAKENFSIYRWSTVLYNLFFEIRCLQKFSSESLFPLNSAFYRKKGKGTSSDFYLINLSPKPDLFSNIATQNKLPDLYFFVRHHLVKRRSLVIPTLEGWIPFCGPRLIKEGMKVFTKFGDLSPNQILLLFNQFSSWPEYEDSAFQAAVSRFFGKEQFPYEDDNSVEI